MIRICRECHSDRLMKNGFNKAGTQQYKCANCGKGFTGNPFGRPPLGERAMTNAERQAKWRANNPK